MNEEPKSFWWGIWGRPVRFFAWPAIVSMLGLIGLKIFLHHHPDKQDALFVLLLAFYGVLILSGIGLLFSAIPVTRPLMMWALRRWLFSIAAFATLIALCYAEEDWRGKRAWEQAQQQLEAQGIDMNWDHYVPPQVPDDQNIFKAPKMREWFVRTSPPQPPTEWEWGKRLTANPKTASATNAITTEADARDYLAWSDQFTPDFHLMREALKRPYARIEGDYSRPFSAPIPDFVRLRAVARVLAERAHCFLLLHEPDRALAELTLAHDLCRACEAAPSGQPMFLVLAMINVAITGLWVDHIGDGLRLHVWQEPQLVVLEDQLKDVRLLHFVAESFKGEPAATRRTFEMEILLKNDYPVDSTKGFFDSTKGFFSITPRGWLYQNLVNLVTAYQMREGNLDPVRELVSPSACKQNADRVETFLEVKSPFRIFAAIAVANFSKATQTVARNQNLANEALVACALERYRMAHNEYPESLDALAPQFIEKLPHDIINGGPLKYRREGDSFVLYSIGWNEKDDGGVSVHSKNGLPEWDNGDWVWPYSGK
jgi:hypothetical protein